MRKQDYERKQAKIRRQKRFLTNERAASRKKTIPKTAPKHKHQVNYDWDEGLDEGLDVPDGVQFRE